MVPKKNTKQILVQNRRARYDFEIIEIFEAGIELQGTEVKSLRDGKANLSDSFASPVDGELYLHNCHISAYKNAQIFNHEEKRKRRLLLHRREINKLLGLTEKKGFTLVPLSIYLNKKNFIKVELALASGKKKFDKRQAEKNKEWQRTQQTLLKKSIQ